MNEEKRALLMIGSHLLSYPSDEFIQEGKTLEQTVQDLITCKNLKQALQDTYMSLFQLSTQEIQELFVDTFDLKEKLGLYLTAHELGDSNKRGAALIRLQKLVNEAGYEREEGELADYIPMLFEFLAVAPVSNESERLFKRLSVAVSRMLNHIEENNPYKKVLNMLMTYVFPNPSKEDIESLEFNREEADLEDMPYPIMYQ